MSTKTPKKTPKPGRGGVPPPLGFAANPCAGPGRPKGRKNKATEIKLARDVLVKILTKMKNSKSLFAIQALAPSAISAADKIFKLHGEYASEKIDVTVRGEIERKYAIEINQAIIIESNDKELAARIMLRLAGGK